LIFIRLITPDRPEILLNNSGFRNPRFGEMYTLHTGVNENFHVSYISPPIWIKLGCYMRSTLNSV